MGREAAGCRADGGNAMVVADLRGFRTLGKILGVHRAAAGIVFADSGAGQLSGLPADLGRRNRGRNGKSRIGQALMDSGHNIFPDDLMVRGTAADGGNFLVVVAAGPDSRRIVRRVSYEPDIVVAGSRTGLSGVGHIGQVGAGAGGVQVAAAVHTAAFHGLGHGVRQQEGSRIF